MSKNTILLAAIFGALIGIDSNLSGDKSFAAFIMILACLTFLASFWGKESK